MMRKIRHIVLFLLLLNPVLLFAEDGYELWLRYKRIDDQQLLSSYQQEITCLYRLNEGSQGYPAHEELLRGLKGLLDKNISKLGDLRQGTVIAGLPQHYSIISELISKDSLNLVTKEGFIIKSVFYKGKKLTLLTATNEIGLLYGSFQFLRLLQTQQSITNLNILSNPTVKFRMLNHWDNLNRTVERGYAGMSIWNWHTLPDYKDPRYTDYARANASIGINAVSLTNVNANAIVLKEDYIYKVAALARIFRPYGIKVFLTARFSAPMEIGNLRTSDPLNDSVRNWWMQKVKYIYGVIPDFGGFLVKANSEGQPGPQNYGRTHSDGANMLADALAPYNGVVMWRAFVYNQQSDDRFKQAYEEFKPLDGEFRPNVLVQVKNGPIDFQPREPFSPLFGAMKKTPLMMEFQLTQEYLGQGTHLVYEAPLFKEVLNADTYVKGKGSTVQKVIDGSLYNQELTGMAGVANIGSDRNWTGHLFGQANWYALGRLAWDPSLSSEEIADEWVRQTFNNSQDCVDEIKKIMLASREILVNYMTPLGLHHIMANGHHYGPAPWSDNLPRPDWNPVYYHKADENGIGFNRTSSGTNALSQYAPEVRAQFEDSNTVDEKYFLWFHHVSWNHKMKSGRTLWEELCFKYDQGVHELHDLKFQWAALQKCMDRERYLHVYMLLEIQFKEAIWWKNACVSYFQTFSKLPYPQKFVKPDNTLDYYKSLKFPYAPGN